VNHVSAPAGKKKEDLKSAMAFLEIHLRPLMTGC
jgi:hypothetical protein